MNAKELRDIISRDRNVYTCFEGIFAIDNLPQKVDVDKFIIVNTAPSSHSGAHWFLVFHYDDYTFEVFDSLGCSIAFIKKHLPYKHFNFDINKSPVQHSSSKTCGLFCVVYAFERIYNYDTPMQEVINDIFSVNVLQNESVVLNYFK